MMTSTVTILGAKRSKGVLDNGNSYDSTKIYVQTAMRDTADTVGFAGLEYNWGTSDNFEILKSLKFPIQAEITFEMVTNGKTMQTIVTDVKPLTTAVKDKV